MKKFTFKGVLDGFRSSVSTSGGPGGNPGNKSYEQDINEILKPEHFNVTKVNTSLTPLDFYSIWRI